MVKNTNNIVEIKDNDKLSFLKYVILILDNNMSSLLNFLFFFLSFL